MANIHKATVFSGGSPVALVGRLEEIALPSIIQISCMEGNQARLVLRQDEQTEETAELYFADGQIVHAAWGDSVGAEVVYELLKWNKGVFELQNGVTPPDNEAHVDHRYPRSKGGSNSYDNLDVRSRRNNLRKSDNVE